MFTVFWTIAGFCEVEVEVEEYNPLQSPSFLRSLRFFENSAVSDNLYVLKNF